LLYYDYTVTQYDNNGTAIHCKCVKAWFDNKSQQKVVRKD